MVRAPAQDPVWRGSLVCPGKWRKTLKSHAVSLKIEQRLLLIGHQTHPSPGDRSTPYTWSQSRFTLLDLRTPHPPPTSPLEAITITSSPSSPSMLLGNLILFSKHGKYFTEIMFWVCYYLKTKRSHLNRVSTFFRSPCVYAVAGRWWHTGCLMQS